MQWRDVPGYVGLYEVSDTGLIRNWKTHRVLKPRVNWDGSRLVNLSDCGIQKSFVLHRIVAMVFIKQPEGMKFVKHKDGDKSNNDIGNLYWDRTRQYLKEKAA